MPYVATVFDPSKISQETIDRLKPWLQTTVAEVLSTSAVQHHSNHRVHICTDPSEIFVYQHEVHPTDVNAAPLEIFIQAGRPQGRSGDKIVELLGRRICETGWISPEYLGEGQSCIFVTFHEYNGFGFIPARS